MGENWALLCSDSPLGQATDHNDGGAVAYLCTACRRHLHDEQDDCKLGPSSARVGETVEMDPKIMTESVVANHRLAFWQDCQAIRLAIITGRNRHRINMKSAGVPRNSSGVDAL